jgi:hypothetical protein
VCTFRRSEGKLGTKSDDVVVVSTKLVMSQQHKNVARDYKKYLHIIKRKMRCYYYAKGTSGRTFKQIYFLADGSN